MVSHTSVRETALLSVEQPKLRLHLSKMGRGDTGISTYIGRQPDSSGEVTDGLKSGLDDLFNSGVIWRFSRCRAQSSLAQG